MKRISFLLVALLSVSFSSQAGETTPQYLNYRLQHVKKHILQDISLTAWANAMQQASKEAQIYGGLFQYKHKKFPLPLAQTATLTEQKQGVFDERQRALQGALRNNPLFSVYTISVPRNTDLTELNESQFALVKGFLEQPAQIDKVSARYKNIPVEMHKHYIVKITLPGDELHTVFLLVDCFHKRVHLVNLNLTIENLPGKSTKPGEEFITKK
jgi:hypothetical protein